MLPCSRFTELAACWIVWTGVLGAQQQSFHDHQRALETRYSRSLESYRLPAITLHDCSGKPFAVSSLDSYPGPVILQFIFTTCSTVCPIMSAALAAAQDKLGPELDRIRMVSITIDPENDTPARLAEYAKRWKARGQWLFLTGREPDIVRLRQAFRVYTDSKMRHQPITFLRASPDQPWVRLNGLMSAGDLVSEYHRSVGR
jgi:protein SCO1/2